mmetsp:Transcript_10510/g.38112  ORF Transcript_10510/g.38112 Transcript_10510/m.38112 type:complete len:204 (+) Transcript_10510:515-1126(+)
MKTSWIISPPPIHGGIVSRTSARPHRNPIPVGAHILCPDATIQSTPNVFTSIGMCGTDWHASRSTFAPTLFASFTSRGTSTSLPRTLDTCAVAINFVFPSRADASNASMSIPFPSGASPTCRSVAPVCAHTSCHGTMLLWCSSSEMITSSPGFKLATPHVYATKLIASDALRVKTISRSVSAPMKSATLTRASSYASVALPLR